ncbi:MAG: type 2 isopentenyl-diphosphate Delta-isomerase [Ignavibacteriales bacterium]|nr:type 2 isopentenyl-diphosphate Delta-isomerase [Ignavibacteriales bacterium]
MIYSPENISLRKKEHIELSLTDKVAFKEKSNGFDKYDFEHYAITEVDIKKIDFGTKFFHKKIKLPFLISCMTGGTPEAENINEKLAIAANSLQILLGVGSQRQALENKLYHKSYKVIRKHAPNIPILGNIGAAQVCGPKSVEQIKYLIDLIQADAFVVHVNPLQELLQKNGEPNFKNLLNMLDKICGKIDIPIIVKEVGSGISKRAAFDLLNVGVKGIDVAGAGGTSWAGVEILRSKENKNNIFWDWGLPTSYCLRTVNQLKSKNNFLLIGSGGIFNGFDIAKAMVLGADITASARIILQELDKNNIEGVEKLIAGWFDTVKKIMFLTGCSTVDQFKKQKLIKKEELY